jgi:hypothetical protein
MKTMILRTLAVGLAAAAMGCAGGASSQWDAQAASSLHAEPELILRELDAGDVAGMLAKMDDDSIVLDIDENNHPVRYQGRERVTQYFSGLGQAMKAQGLKFTSTIASNDCKATSTVG